MCGFVTNAIGSIFGGGAALKAQKQAQAQNVAQAQADQLKSTEQFNAANQKAPDIAGMMAANTEKANQGLAATFLTGPTGVASTSLSLGSPTLLGGSPA